MNGQQKHEMILGITHPSGAEEWHCPVCGRRLLISWEPNFKKTILEAGDEFSIHSGGKGGLRIGASQVTQVNSSSVEQEPSTLHEDASLAPWEAWMQERGFEDLWGDDES